MKIQEKVFFTQQREEMLQGQITARGVRNPFVLQAMREIPRHLFMPHNVRDRAYDDCPLPIGKGQTISQPYIVAYMTECLQLLGGERVLEIGSGRGYQAAVLSRIAARVYTVERIPELAAQAQQTFAALELTNIEIRTGDGTLGWEEKAPFEAIVVTASGPDIPEPLKRQLTINGRLVMPVGSLHHGQQILRVTRTDDDAFTTEYLLQVAFVPLLGKFGWKEA